MNQETWTAVDRYIEGLFVPKDAVLEAALKTSAEAGLPAIAVSPGQGKLLHVLARLVNARRILEIGTLGGYSTIWLARALPEAGRLVTLEAEPKHAEIARGNITRAGLSEKVQIVIGRALETLPKVAAEAREPFDLIFIDADKPSITEYFQWSLKLSRRGSLIIVDNVVRKGAVVEAQNSDANVQGTRRFNKMLAANPQVVASEIQTVGAKGYDGFAIAVVTGVAPGRAD